MGDSEVTSAEVNGLSVETNTGETSEEITQALSDEEDKPEKPDLKKAASELGKKGGKAAAKARAAKAEEAPQEDPDEAQPAKEAPGSEEEPEAADEAQEDEDKQSEDKPEEKKLGKPRHDPRARMLEATRQAAEAKRDRDAAIARASALEERLAAIEEKVAPPPKAEAKANGDARPKVDDFDDYESYLDARDEYNRAELRRELQEEQMQRSQADDTDRALMAQIDKFRQSTQDHLERFSEDVLSLKTEFQLQEGERSTAENWIANELFSSPETAPSLMLHFTEHPDDLQRIAALTTPRAVSREMAKLEARLEAATAVPSSSERDEVSKAKPPVRPVAGTPRAADGVEFRDDMSFDDYFSRNRKKFNIARR